MSLIDIPAPPNVTTKPIVEKDRSRRNQVTGRLRDALTNMIWQGLPRKEAAASAGLTEHALYSALRKPHVKQWYLAELDVLRTSARARNIHVLEEVRDQTGNQMARVNAVKALEQIADDPQRGPAAQTTPGLIIQVINQVPVNPPITANGAKPLITLDRVRDEP